MAEPFQVRIQVRGYEVDTQGHLNQAVYLQYAEHARWEFFRAAGLGQDRLLASGIGPVQLQVTVRYLKELRAGDEVDVSCAIEWDGGSRSGRTFRLRQEYRLPDDTLAADLDAVVGMMDLKTRKLVPDAAERLRAMAAVPEMFA